MAKDSAKILEKPQEDPAQKALREIQKLTDSKERKAYYWAHPELHVVYSPVNFH